MGFFLPNFYPDCFKNFVRRNLEYDKSYQSINHITRAGIYMDNSVCRPCVRAISAAFFATN